jgi:PAT family beta-lactamase induction signal transducer AmpG
MKALTESRLLRFMTFGALYLAQGIPWGFIAVGYVVLLADRGLGNEAVGKAIGIAYVPWSFKVILGPLVDRFPSARFGRRRHFIIAAEALMGATLLLLLPLDPRTELGLISVVLFAHNTFAALQDVAVDALAVDVLAADERGRANSIMWACKSAGVAIGGGGGTVVAKYFGWSTLFIAMALTIWAVMIIPILVRERPSRRRPSAGSDGDVTEGAAAARSPESARPQRLTLGELRRSFSFAAPLVGLAIALLAPAGYALVSGVFTRMLRADLKLSEEAIATLSGVVDPVSGVAGALLGGFVADRIGARKAIAIFMVGIAVTLAAFGALPAAWPSFGFLVGFSICQNLVIYAFNASTLGFFMTLSNPAIGATQFTVFMAMTNLCYAMTAPLGGRIADSVGFVPLFFVAAGVQLAAIALLPFCDAADAERRFRMASP